MSEGFSLSEEDPKLDELLAAFPVLRAMWDKAHKSLDRDAWGNPKLTGASLYVVGILEHFCHAKEVGRTDLTYQLRGAFSEKDSDGKDFEKFLAGGFSKVAILDLEENGLAVVYDGNYGEYDPDKFGTRPAEEVYKTKNLDDLMSEQEMARLGVLGTTGVVFKADPVSVPEKDVTLERAMMEAFFANAVSTAAHTYASVMEFRQSSEAIVDSCGKKKASEIAGLPYDLGTVIEGTQDSVLVLIPDRQVSFYEIAQRIKEVVDTAGYVNIAVSKDFALYTKEKDKLLAKVLQMDPILKVKYEEGKKSDTDLVTFDSGIRYFIAGLFKYLQLKEKEEKGSGIKVEGVKMADMGYAFEGLNSEGYPEGLLDDDNLLTERGVIGANTGNLLQRRAVESGV